MGLFQKLPEDPIEWAGLPSEPLPERSAAERLDEAPPATDLMFGAGYESHSLAVPIAPVDDADGD